jgi:hypothetical protein
MFCLILYQSEPPKFFTGWNRRKLFGFKLTFPVTFKFDKVLKFLKLKPFCFSSNDNLLLFYYLILKNVFWR